MKQIIYIFLIGMTLILTSDLYSQSPILGYSFSGNSNDDSGNGNNGIVVDAVLTEDFNGVPNSAYEFNGSSSYISAGESETLKVDTALTIMACIYPTGNGSPNSGGIIVNKEGEYSFARFEDGSLRFAIADINGWDIHINTNTIIPLNEQTHVALTYSKAEGVIKIFVNSNLIFTDNFSSTIGDDDTSLNELRVGGRQFLNQFFEGIIDEVKVYNIALSEEDINCELTTSTKNIENKERLNIYPNPASDNINISNLKEDVRKIEIYDFSGKKVKEQYTNNVNSIDISDLNPGHYIIKIISKDIIQASRIVKM